MKITIFVLLSVITFVVCTVPPEFKKQGPPKGKNCICREKECTDVSCEEKNCLCLVKAIKGLQANANSKYDKKWLDAYLKLIQERCLCIEACEKVCSPKEFIQCSSAAFDRFLCKFQDFIETIVGKPGYDAFFEDIKKITAECINKDCKPVCTGNGDCDPFSLEIKDCGCTKECVKKLLASLAALIKNQDVKEELTEFAIYVNAFYDQMQNCKHLPPKAQAVCINSALEEINRALSNLLTNLVKISGPCTAISILNTIKQGVIDCAIKK